MASPILFFFLLSTALPLPVHSSAGFSIDLIHRDSSRSPFYNPSLSNFGRIRAAAQRSVARAESFRALTVAAANGSSVPTESRVVPDSNGSEYLMTISIGTPPLEILGIADTGSDLVWTQCKPCTGCFNENGPIFDPMSSSSYGTVPCSASSCSTVKGSCSSNGSLCQYDYKYADESATTGILSAETFTFDSDGSKKATVPKILFGCSHQTTGGFSGDGPALVGLGGGPLSLISQLGSSIDNKFSYSLIPPSDNKNSASLLNFGEKAKVTGPHAVTTPMVTGLSPTFYTLSLEDISVGDQKAGTGQGDIIIDSGTTLTILDNSMMEPLTEKVMEALIQYVLVPPPYDPFNLCFDVNSQLILGMDIELPDLTFQFSGGAPVKLPPENVFVEVEDGILCMAIVSSGEDGGVRIFGNIAQQNLQVGYDLGARKLTFAPALAVGGTGGGGAGIKSNGGVRVSCVSCTWTVAWLLVVLVGILL